MKAFKRREVTDLQQLRSLVADNADELVQRLRQVEPDARKVLGLEVGADYDAVQEIWGLP